MISRPGGLDVGSEMNDTLLCRSCGGEREI